MKRAARLGVDVGGVIIGADNDTTMFTRNYLEAAPVAGVFDALAILRERFSGELFIVSKAGPEMREKTLHWMAVHNFWNRVGMTRRLEDHARRDQNVFFCRERADKAPICKRISITHFIDDRADVLSYLRDIVPNRYLFGAGVTRGQIERRPPKAVIDWETALKVVWP